MALYREWQRRVRQLPDPEWHASRRVCEIDGCDEPGRFEVSWFYYARIAGRPWHRRRRVCETGAREFARKHDLRIEQPRQVVAS